MKECETCGSRLGSGVIECSVCGSVVIAPVVVAGTDMPVDVFMRGSVHSRLTWSSKARLIDFDPSPAEYDEYIRTA